MNTENKPHIYAYKLLAYFSQFLPNTRSFLTV